MKWRLQARWGKGWGLKVFLIFCKWVEACDENTGEMCRLNVRHIHTHTHTHTLHSLGGKGSDWHDITGVPQQSYKALLLKGWHRHHWWDTVYHRSNCTEILLPGHFHLVEAVLMMLSSISAWDWVVTAHWRIDSVNTNPASLTVLSHS